MTKKEKHCCNFMSEFISDKRVNIGYRSKFRKYFIPLSYEGEITAIQCIYYCPWCGEKLPTSLTNKWFEILEKEYGLDDPDGKAQKKLIPEEFKTDKWWKKRGL